MEKLLNFKLIEESKQNFHTTTFCTKTVTELDRQVGYG